MSLEIVFIWLAGHVLHGLKPLNAPSYYLLLFLAPFLSLSLPLFPLEHYLFSFLFLFTPPFSVSFIPLRPSHSLLSFPFLSFLILSSHSSSFLVSSFPPFPPPFPLLNILRSTPCRGFWIKSSGI